MPPLFADLPVDLVTGYVRAAADGSSEIDEMALALVADRAPRARITVHRAIERVSGDPVGRAPPLSGGRSRAVGGRRGDLGDARRQPGPDCRRPSHRCASSSGAG